MKYRLLRLSAPAWVGALSLCIVSAAAEVQRPPQSAHEPKLAQTLKRQIELSSVPLCELLLDPASGADQQATAAAYAQRLEAKCSLLARALEHAHDGGDEIPRLSVNGILMRAVALDDPQWRRALQQALADARAAPFWELELYLAKTTTREGTDSIDFSVCNRGQGQDFNGAFRLLLAERRSSLAQQGVYWRVLREIVQAPIADLAPAAVAGCPLPERFDLPTSSAGLPVSIIAIVDDTAGRAQALLTIPLHSDGSRR